MITVSVPVTFLQSLSQGGVDYGLSFLPPCPLGLMHLSPAVNPANFGMEGKAQAWKPFIQKWP